MAATRSGSPPWCLALAGQRWPISTSGSPRGRRTLMAHAIRKISSLSTAHQLPARAPMAPAWGPQTLTPRRRCRSLPRTMPLNMAALPARRFVLLPRPARASSMARPTNICGIPPSMRIPGRAMPTRTALPLLQRRFTITSLATMSGARSTFLENSTPARARFSFIWDRNG